MPELLIRVQDVSKIYNAGRPDEVRALHGVSMQVTRGEALALVGPSGSGKSTLLSLIACMSRPTSGVVRLGDREVSRLPEHFAARVRRESFGFMFQQSHLIPDLSVLDNVLVPLFPSNMPFDQMRERATATLDRLGMKSKIARKARSLSGGERQRTAIARAIVHDPRIVIADEPTAHLDHALAEDLLNILADLKSDGRTLLIATHDALVFQHPLVTRILRLRDGMIEGEDAS